MSVFVPACNAALRRPRRTQRRLAIFIVITGGPSVGKTTIIMLLRERGYTVVDEQATQIIKEGQVLPWVDRDGFQKEVLRRQLAVEALFSKNRGPVFLDRGLFDGEAYYISDGLQPPPIFSNVDPSRYSLALLIEELSFFDNNGVRFEDLEFTRKFTPVVESCYTTRGVPLQRVPAMPPKERVDFVVKTVSEYLEEILEPATSPVMPFTPSFALA